MRGLGSARSFAILALTAAVLVVAGCSRVPSAKDNQRWNAELLRLQTTQDSLRARAAELVAKDTRIGRLPEGDVIVSVPTSFVRGIVERVFQDVADNVTLRLRDIRAHVEKSVKKVVTLGNFTVDVLVREVTGKLHPGKPEVRFTDNRVAMTLPVQLSEGIGKASIHFVWDGKNIADVACGDLDVTQDVSGNAIPTGYVVHGSLALGLRGQHIVATPRFPETRINIRVRPSKASWDAIDKILAEKQGVCGFVLDKVDVKEILRNVTETKGFNVRLPLGKLKPFVIPAGITDSVSVGGRTMAVSTTTNTIRIEEDAILYSAGVRLSTISPD